MNRYEERDYWARKAQAAKRLADETQRATMHGWLAGVFLAWGHQFLLATFWLLICIMLFELPMLLPIPGLTAFAAFAAYLLAWALFGFPKAKDGRLGGSQ